MSVRVERAGPVLTVILARARVRNAVDGPTAQALADAFREFEQDDSAAVAVLWGEGPMGPSRMQLTKPVIAAIEGHAVAGGLELACWCDLRVAARDAVLGVFCRRFGVPLIDGGTVRLPRLIGQSRALDLILTGRPVDAEEALRIGLVNRVVEPGQARSAAEQLARELSSFPQQCLRNDRQSLYRQWDLDEQAALGNEFQLGMDVIRSGEALAGATAFSGGKGRGGKF